jgi:hypothetical protein
MANRSLLGLFSDAESAAKATGQLQEARVPDLDFDILTSSPYPEGAFGEKSKGHRLFVFPFVGALCGLTVALLLTVGTQISYPVVTGGKPILSIPPMAIIAYEGTMLGAIIFTVIGIIFESRLPRPQVGLYDPRITEGYIGVLIDCPDERVDTVRRLLQGAGAVEVKSS